MKIVFMGTPEFAVPSLKALIDSEHEVAAVVSQPDRPSGRGRKITAPPTKRLALQHSIRVLQPSKIKTGEFLGDLEEISPDVICVTAYGRILPEAILNLPPRGCINVHASLLPRYRGAAPVNWAIVRGENVSGVTTMLMDEGMDTGDMLLKREVRIDYEDTGESLSEKLSVAGAELLIETLGLVERGEISPVKQDESLATYAPMLKKEDGLIDWESGAREIRNLVRGMLPWPGAYTYLDGKLLKIYSAQLSVATGSPGQVLNSDKNTLRVATGEGSLDITELQLEGGKRMDIASFLAGRKIEPGFKFG